MKVDPRYVPPAVEGYVWWSNFGTDDASRVLPINDAGRDYVIAATATRFDIPIDDILVVPFTPADGYDCALWAAYVRETHREALDRFRHEVLFRLRELNMIAKATEGQR